MRDILTSPRASAINRSNKIKKIRLTILISILILSIFSSLAYFSADKHVTINSIVVTGNRLVHTDDIVRVANDDLSGKLQLQYCYILNFILISFVCMTINFNFKIVFNIKQNSNGINNNIA